MRPCVSLLDEWFQGVYLLTESRSLVGSQIALQGKNRPGAHVVENGVQVHDCD